MAHGPASESLATTGLGSCGSSANRLPPLLFGLHDRRGAQARVPATSSPSPNGRGISLPN